NEVTILLLERHDALAKMRLCSELSGLCRELTHEILREHTRETAHVEDQLLGIERLELSPELGQGVDDARRHATHAGVELGEQPSGSGANDRDVDELVRCHGLKE